MTEEEISSIVLDEGRTECVSEFPYLGSLIANMCVVGRMVKRIASASWAFGGLRRPVFKDVHTCQS